MENNEDIIGNKSTDILYLKYYTKSEGGLTNNIVVNKS